MDADLLRMIPPLLLVLAVGGLIIALMIRAWRRQGSADEVLGELPTAPAPEPATIVLGPLDGVYVSTTRADDRLTRIGAHTLGERSNARLTLTAPAEAGPVLHIDREGAESFALPLSLVTAAEGTSGLAGKTVGGEGILGVGWDFHGHPVVSGFRLRRRAEHEELLAALRQNLTPATTSGDRA